MMKNYSTILDHNHPNRTITVNPAQTAPKYWIQHPNGTETYEISTKVYHIYATLYNRLLQNNFQPIPICFKQQNVNLMLLPIPPYADLPIRTFSDITCFRITGSYKEVLTFDNLVDISVILADYPAFLTSIQEQKTALQVFYNTHLKGNYTHAYELGKAFHYEAEMEYFQNHLTMNFSQYLQHQFLPNFCQTEQLDPTFVSHALSIYQNWTEYADKYLSLYGTQARFPDTLQFK